MKGGIEVNLSEKRRNSSASCRGEAKGNIWPENVDSKEEDEEESVGVN